jgi:beta-glucosidase
MRERFGDERIAYAPGCHITTGKQGASAWWTDETELATPGDGLEAAVAVTLSADVAVLAIGGNEGTSREAWSSQHLGDRASLALPGPQQLLVEALAATGTPLVAVVFGGRPLELSDVVARCGSVLQVWYPGQEGGRALADIISGDVNPAGKLPMTFPRSAGHIPLHSRAKKSQQRGYLFSDPGPQFPFGHGLSYTTFAYSTPIVDPPVIGQREETTVSVKVTNSGDRSGREIAQCYIADCVASVTRPVQSLAAFSPVDLRPGESKTVTFRIGSRQLEILDRDMKPVVEPGEFEVRIGGSSATVVSATFAVR